MKSILIFTIIIYFTGCSKQIPSVEQRVNTALQLQDKKTTQINIQTKNFNLFTLQKVQLGCKNIKVYIEGDGLAWISRKRISSNPTPINPLALKLMNLDRSSCKIYIARPCQYIDSKICKKKYWTSHRFNSKIIKSYDAALNQLKNTYGNSSFKLIGYSGGGAVVTLLASKREDISKLITIAGNLDHHRWTQLHRIDALDGSLNPVNRADKLEKIPQYHLIGTQDRVIPQEIFFSYQKYFQNRTHIHYKLYDATHTKNWETHYKNFLKEQN
jgi:hypothetical protein